MLLRAGINRDSIKILNLGKNSNAYYDDLLKEYVKNIEYVAYSFQSDKLAGYIKKSLGDDHIRDVIVIYDELLKGEIIELKDGRSIGVFYLDSIYGTQAGIFTQWLTRTVHTMGGKINGVFFNGYCTALDNTISLNDIVIFNKLSGWHDGTLSVR
ncbi:MAG: hypothetical protein GF384_00540, partial [Elusimicrobia bacterium]|nr:hypothetical protein [Elusimicrobiota bacterium]